MRIRSLVALLLLGGIIGFAPLRAFAQDEEDPEPEVSDAGPGIYDRLLAVSVTGGYDTPFGMAGGAVEFSPHPWVTIYAGGGIGRAGGRFAGGLMLQVPVDSSALGLMMGVGGGATELGSRGPENARIRRYWSMGLSFHTALTFQYRFDEGILVRGSFGMDALLGPNTADECTRADGSECGIAGEALMLPVVPWVGLTIGYAFGL